MTVSRSIRWPSTESTWKTTPSCVDLVAGLGGAAERAEDEAGDRVEVLDGQVGRRTAR